MATLAQLESALDQLLDHPAGLKHYQLVRVVEEKAYEAYVFGLCLRAVRELKGAPTLRGISGPPTPFVFRGAPGQIHSTYRNYGYATFSLGTHQFEIHCGVEFKGTSGMTHEIDVCIMKAAEASACRLNPADPKAASVVAAWECKFYSGGLDKSLGRAFVGLMSDLGTKHRISGMCSNNSHQGLKDYFSPKNRPDPHFQLSPLYPDNEKLFVSELAVALRKMVSG
ncbi:MAG: hypothetical protein EKK53_04185 [Burkholderiales bacterium]|nr:MAG: hypothetical protein EKK53_04185 [Burkholderiales bacterium]